MRPTSLPSRTASQNWWSRCSNSGLILGESASLRSIISGVRQLGSLAFSRLGRAMKRSSSASVVTGTISTAETPVSLGMDLIFRVEQDRYGGAPEEDGGRAGGDEGGQGAGL